MKHGVKRIGKAWFLGLIITLLLTAWMAGSAFAGEEDESEDYKAVEDSCQPYSLYYGGKSFNIEALAGTKVSVRIGKEKKAKTITFSEDGTKKFAVKKAYKVGTKITCKFNYYGHTFSKTSKVEAYTSLNYAKANKKKLRLEMYNVHKGDSIRVSYKGKKYTVRVKKNYDRKTHWFTVKLKEKMKKDTTFKIQVINKFKQQIYKAKVYMQDGVENGIE